MSVVRTEGMAEEPRDPQSSPGAGDGPRCARRSRPRGRPVPAGSSPASSSSPPPSSSAATSPPPGSAADPARPWSSPSRTPPSPPPRPTTTDRHLTPPSPRRHPRHLHRGWPPAATRSPPVAHRHRGADHQAAAVAAATTPPYGRRRRLRSTLARYGLVLLVAGGLVVLARFAADVPAPDPVRLLLLICVPPDLGSPLAHGRTGRAGSCDPRGRGCGPTGDQHGRARPRARAGRRRARQRPGRIEARTIGRRPHGQPLRDPRALPATPATTW